MPRQWLFLFPFPSCTSWWFQPIWFEATNQFYNWNTDAGIACKAICSLRTWRASLVSVLSTAFRESVLVIEALPRLLMHFFDEDLKSPCHFRRFQFRSFTPNKLHPKLAQLLRSFSFSLIPACTSRSAQKIHTIKVWKRGISGSPIALCKGETSSFPLEESPTKVWPESFWPRLQHFGVGFSKKISKVFQKAETTKKKNNFPHKQFSSDFFFWALSEIRPPQSLPSHRKDVTRPLIEGFMRSLRRWRKPRRRCARICSFTGFPAWKLWRQKSQGFTACFRRFFLFFPFCRVEKKTTSCWS